MRYTRAAAVGAAMIITLGGCSSTSDDAATSSGGTAASQTSNATTTADETRTGADENGTATGQNGTDENGTDAAIETSGIDGATGTGTGTALGTDAATETAGTDGATGPADAATLDDDTAAWFTAFCSGLGPVVDRVMSLSSSAMVGSGGSDPASAQADAVTKLTTMADGLEDMADGLAGKQPPDIDRGGELSDKLVDHLRDAAPAVRGIGQQLAAQTVTSDVEFQQMMTNVMQQVSDAIGSVGTDDFVLDEDQQGAIEQLPACAPLIAKGASFGN